ncbi:MAG: hypothetical protein QF614_07750, partial [SAR324 cluster bacterium]|nr:hypothetical protein [SAR324 cluster bacterium]
HRGFKKGGLSWFVQASMVGGIPARHNPLYEHFLAMPVILPPDSDEASEDYKQTLGHLKHLPNVRSGPTTSKDASSASQKST